MRPRLFTPGPTQIPERVIAEMSQPLQHHRSPEFKQIFAEVSENLKQFFRTAGEVLTLTTSGSGAMESAVVNLLSKGDKVISIEGGKFGERWGEICRAYGLQVVDIQVPWGDSIPAEEVRTTVRQHSDATAVFMTHSETSTGVAFDVKGISEVVHAESDALLIVDGITSIGVLPFEKDQWHIDVAVSGSQKGVMIPPGLAFIALNDRAWDRAQNSDLPKYYLSLLKARKALAQQSTPFTPATTLLIGLRLSLEMILADGLPSFGKNMRDWRTPPARAPKR